MLHFIVNHWIAPLVVLIASLGFLRWKVSGGNLLFKIKQGDDPIVCAFKMIAGLIWAFVSSYLAIWLAVLSGIWLIVGLTARACGVL